MIRQHKKMILLTSIATLLPILIGLLLWKQLPDSVATHWSTGNEPDGYSSKAFAVFGLPVIMLILHLVCVIATNIDPKANWFSLWAAHRSFILDIRQLPADGKAELHHWLPHFVGAE